MSANEITPAMVSSLAEQLFEAENKREFIAPLTESAPKLNLQDAYHIQQINIDRRLAQGEKIVGHKIGLTAIKMQELFGVDEPDYGHLLNTMLHDESKSLNMRDLIDPQVEVEPAFVLKKALMGPNVSLEDVLDATEYVSVCFEIIDSRIDNWRIKLQDTVADNGSSARVVMGSLRVKPEDLVLDNLETVLKVDGEIVETGNTRDILGHPGNGIVWLANKISDFGVGLNAGDIVLPGTCTKSFRMAGHKNVTGHIQGLGEVFLTLSGNPTVC